MTVKKMLVLFIAGALIFGSAIAQEQPKAKKTPKITKKQVHQKARIKQGVKSGELTKGEAAKLKKEQAKIQKHKKAAKADGKVTPQEREKIRREQKKASHDIYRLKHNEKTKENTGR